MRLAVSHLYSDVGHPLFADPVGAGLSRPPRLLTPAMAGALMRFGRLTESGLDKPAPT